VIVGKVVQLFISYHVRSVIVQNFCQNFVKLPPTWKFLAQRCRPPSSSRLSKVIDFGANRKPICNFLLVTNSNFARISYRFPDTDA